jgi:hypothetical protein
MLRFVLLSILAFPLAAQDRIGTIQVRVSTDRSDWRYEPGHPSASASSPYKTGMR